MNNKESLVIPSDANFGNLLAQEFGDIMGQGPADINRTAGNSPRGSNPRSWGVANMLQKISTNQKSNSRANKAIAQTYVLGQMKTKK